MTPYKKLLQSCKLPKRVALFPIMILDEMVNILDVFFPKKDGYYVPPNDLKNFTLEVQFFIGANSDTKKTSLSYHYEDNTFVSSLSTLKIISWTISLFERAFLSSPFTSESSIYNVSTRLLRSSIL